MHTHRLRRLSRLAQGAALLGFGGTGLACGGPQASINGPPDDPGRVEIALADGGTATSTPPTDAPPSPCCVNARTPEEARRPVTPPEVAKDPAPTGQPLKAPPTTPPPSSTVGPVSAPHPGPPRYVNSRNVGD